jgi:group I intron endonuclease
VENTTVVELDVVLCNTRSYYLGDLFKVEIGNCEYFFLKADLSSMPKKLMNRYYTVKTPSNGAYVLQSCKTGHVYFGSAENVYDRITKHKWMLSTRMHSNRALTKLIEEEDLFVSDFNLIVIFTETRDQAFDLEQYFLDRFKGNDLLLNSGLDVRVAMLGRPLTEEHKQKIAEANLGRKFSEESLKRMSDARRTSDKAKEQLSQIQSERQKKINLNGVLYQSVTEAIKVTGIPESVLFKQIRKAGKHIVDDAYVVSYTKPKPRKVMIDNVIYESIRDAADKLSLDPVVIKNRIRYGKVVYYESEE